MKLSLTLLLGLSLAAMAQAPPTPLAAWVLRSKTVEPPRLVVTANDSIPEEPKIVSLIPSGPISTSGPIPPSEERWVTVTYGDVDEIAERMNEIYKKQGGGQQTPRTNAPPTPGVPTAEAATSIEDIPLRIIGVSRIKQIRLLGRPSDLLAVESMIRAFDQPRVVQNRQTFRLRYLPVSDFLKIAGDAISVTLGDGEAGTQGEGRRNFASGNNKLTSGSQTGDQAPKPKAKNSPMASESLLIGRTLLEALNFSNLIRVTGPPHHIKIVRDLILDLDIDARQVSLSAVIGNYEIGDGLNFGVDLARVLRRTDSKFATGSSVPFGGIPPITHPSPLMDLGRVLSINGIAGNGVSIYGLLGDDLGAFIDELEPQTRFKTRERSVLMTRNNQVASLPSVQRCNVPANSFASGVTSAGASVKLIDVELNLEIKPVITLNHQIQLEISLVRKFVDADQDVDEPTVLSSEELTTSMTVPDGKTVILGGIMTMITSDAKSEIPTLSRIPGIGRIYGRTDKMNLESELIIMIQPRIVKAQDEIE